MNAQTTLPYELAGSSPVVRDCVEAVDRAAADDRGVLIAAERGLDAASVARAVHARSDRRARPFVVAPTDGPVNDVERSLLGPDRGATGAAPEHVAPSSALASAAGGVLFIPDLADLPTTLQRRLARVLRDGEARVGRRVSPVRLDVRVIGSAPSTLDESLRDDLARRLPLVIEVPPLRHRRADVPAIAEAMLAGRNKGRQFTPAALTVLSALPWRRNTAELAGLIERLASADGHHQIRQEDVLAEVQLDRSPLRITGSLREARRQFEREYITAVLRDHDWQVREAAQALGIERANLYRKARELGIPLRRSAEPPRNGRAR